MVVYIILSGPPQGQQQQVREHVRNQDIDKRTDKVLIKDRERTSRTFSDPMLCARCSTQKYSVLSLVTAAMHARLPLPLSVCPSFPLFLRPPSLPSSPLSHSLARRAPLATRCAPQAACSMQNAPQSARTQCTVLVLGSPELLMVDRHRGIVTGFARCHVPVMLAVD